MKPEYVYKGYNMFTMNIREQNLHFIEEVKKYPELYNFTLPEYSRKSLTEESWKKVSDAVNIPVHDCKEKWRTLKAFYIRRLTRPPPKRSSYYYLEYAMKFYLPFAKLILFVPNRASKKVTNMDHQYIADYHKPKKKSLQMNKENSCSEGINRNQSAKMFLLSLMPEIEELNDNQIKLFKRRVLSAIDDVANC